MISAVLPRHTTVPVCVDSVTIGGKAPIVVQSMTNTDTADIEKTVEQIVALTQAGSELVRLTVNTEAAAKAVPYIRDRLETLNVQIPLVGDFHYHGDKLLTKYPDCAKALSKYRINPGNVGKDSKFAIMIETALTYGAAIRIGVNWGSLDRKQVAAMMDKNAKRLQPLSAEEITREALIESAISSAECAEKIGMERNRIVLSCKVSEVQALISVYRRLAARCDYALHLGLTEAGMGLKGIVASTAAIGILLQEGIGDTIRVSLTPEPGGARTNEVTVAQQILQTMGLRAFVPAVTACPGCGRTTSTLFQHLAADVQNYVQIMMPTWKKSFDGVENLSLAVMGCVVNGPGESKNADIGISLPGTGEEPKAPVFVDGARLKILKGADLFGQFKEIVDDYVATRYDKKI